MRRTVRWVWLGLLIASGTAWACGLQFRQMLLDRTTALNSVIVTNFYAEAARLVTPPDDKLPSPRKRQVQNGREIPYLDAPPEMSREDAEGQGLSQAQVQQLARMRAAATGDDAWARGLGLPTAIRLYTAGAADFQRLGHGPCHPPAASDEADDDDAAPVSPADEAATRAAQKQHYLALEQRWQALLQLPPKERRSRAVWAAFSLGRAQVEMCQTDAALRSFATTRALVLAGTPDPLGLGRASLGEEARVHWRAKRVSPAVALWAEQAARGDAGAGVSLRMVASHLLANPKELQPWLHDAHVQRLVTQLALQNADLLGSRGGTTEPLRKAVLSLLDALERLEHQAQAGKKSNALAEPDTVAALAYAADRYALAQHWAAQSHTPLAEWVQAKVSLRLGHLDQAARHYGLAVNALRETAPNDGALDAPSRARRQNLPIGYLDIEGESAEAPPVGTLGDQLRGEAGVLMISRGDFLQALALLYQSASVNWGDAAYVAERLLTTTELKAFVDANVPEPPLPTAHLTDQGEIQGVITEPGSIWPITHPAAQLRALLGRRLMREGRLDEALPYLPQPGDLRFGDPQARTHAKAYATALRAAPKAWTRVGQAFALWDAAQLLRQYGMDLVGYELGPDGTVVQGMYSINTPTPASGPLAQAGERTRYAATQPAVAARFHYRVLAAQLAEHAAGFLPPGSQAGAATLCQAASWRLSVDDRSGAWADYQRYVHTGPAQDWAAHFGADCPEPSLWSAHRRAVSLVWQSTEHQWRTAARQHRGLIKAILWVLLLVGLFGLWRVGRRVRRGRVSSPQSDSTAVASAPQLSSFQEERPPPVSKEPE